MKEKVSQHITKVFGNTLVFWRYPDTNGDFVRIELLNFISGDSNGRITLSFDEFKNMVKEILEED